MCDKCHIEIKFSGTSWIWAWFSTKLQQIFDFANIRNLFITTYHLETRGIIRNEYFNIENENGFDKSPLICNIRAPEPVFLYFIIKNVTHKLQSI